MKKIILLSFCILITASGCASTKAQSVYSSLLNGKSYQLTSLSPEANITISFDDSKYFGFSAINNYSGTYEIRSGNMIIFKNPISTLMSGPPALMAAEDRYMKTLMQAERVEVSGTTLKIITIDGEVLTYREIKK